MSKVRLLDNRWFAPVLVAVFVLGLAVTAQAAPNLYRGSVVVEGFGNDTTIGTAYPYTIQVFLGVPFGQDCNANYGPYTNGCGGYEPNGQGGSPLVASTSASSSGEPEFLGNS